MTNKREENKEMVRRILNLLANDPETTTQVPVEDARDELRRMGVDPDSASQRLKASIEDLLRKQAESEASDTILPDAKWIHAASDKRDPIAGELTLRDLLAIGPPPIVKGEKALAAKADAGMGFSLLTSNFSVDGVKCQLCEKSKRVFLVPPAGRKPRKLRVGDHEYETIEEDVGCFEIQGLSPDDAVRISNDIKKDPASHEYNAEWDE